MSETVEEVSEGAGSDKRRVALAVALRLLSISAVKPMGRRLGGVGCILELARQLDAWRLVRALEAHKDDLSRQIEAR